MALLALAVLPLGLQVGGCQKVSLFAPSNSTITLAAGTQTLPVGGTTNIRAFVVASGGAPVHDHTVVYFTNSLGALTPQQAETTDGVAAVEFSAGFQTGQAQIGAVSGAAKLSQALTITIGGAGIGKILLSAFPSTVPVGGGTVQLQAQVQDTNGNPVANVPVNFTTTAGTLSNTSPLSDLNGTAITTLTTTTIAVVTASVQGATATVVINIQ
jgi:adhesin/invasin